MGTIQYNSIARITTTSPLTLIAQVGIGSMGGDECLCLRGDGGKHAFLVEAHAVGTASVG